MITFNLGNDSPKKDKQQDIKIADLQAAVDELNSQIDAISITLGNLSASIDDKYAAQTQTLMNALTAQINSLSSALESALTTGQLTAQIANIERLMVTVSAGFVALEAETAKIESLEAEGIESDSVKADSAEIQTLSAEKAVFNEATITLLNMLALTVQSLTADTASIEEVTAEKISTEKIETDLLNAEHIAGGAWHTPISTPDNTELLHISIPRYNGMAQLQTEDNEFNVSILNNYLVAYNQRGEYLYRIERKDESIDIYLQNVGDTVNYRVLFVGSETSGTVTSEIVDKTAYRQTITDFAGVLSLESGVLDVNILFCDYLPDEGEENNLYVVKTQGSYLWNENAREFIPLMGTNWQTKILSNESKIGDLTQLSTEVKTDLVSALNEVDSHADTNSANIGTLSSLTTTATADLVSAINEVDSHADTNASDISTIIGNDTGKSMREVAQEVSATVYTPQGSCTFANLPSLSASSTKVGFVYDVIDSFTTTSDFKEGAGIDVPAGTNIVVADVSGTKMWDLLGFNIDLSPYQKKVMTSAVSVGGVSQNTVEGAIGALANLPSEAVFHVATLPTGSSIQNVIYHNTTDGKYYVGNKTAQTVVELDTTVIEYVHELPSSGIEDKLYCVDPTRPHEEELVGFDILTNKNDDVLFKWWDDGNGTQRAMKFPVDLYQNNELLASISEINPSYGYSTDIYFDYDTSHPNTIGIVHYNNDSSNQRIDANTKLVFHDVVRPGEKKLYYGDKENQTVNSVVYVPVDVVADGNMNPVTSNAVYNKLVQSETNATLSSLTTGGSVTCQKYGNVVTIFTSGSQGKLSGNWNPQWNVVATIPEGYRPTHLVGGSWSSPRRFDNATCSGTGCMYISTDGSISVYLPQILSEDGWISFNISYVI